MADDSHSTNLTRPKFELGKIVITTNALSQIGLPEAAHGLARHSSGDWGEVDEEDRQANEEALKEGNRLLSAYQTADGVKFWIITERDKSITTILLPEDY